MHSTPAFTVVRCGRWRKDLGQAESPSSVQAQCPKAEVTIGEGRVKDMFSVLLSVLSLRPLCSVFPSWVFGEPLERSGALLA